MQLQLLRWPADTPTSGLLTLQRCRLEAHPCHKRSSEVRATPSSKTLLLRINRAQVGKVEESVCSQRAALF